MGKGLVMVTGSFSGGTEAATKKEGIGWSVAWDATGVYEVTFTEAYPALVSLTLQLQADDTGDIKGFTVYPGLLADRILPVSVYDEADTLADLADDAEVHFVAWFRNTTVGF